MKRDFEILRSYEDVKLERSYEKLYYEPERLVEVEHVLIEDQLYYNGYLCDCDGFYIKTPRMILDKVAFFPDAMYLDRGDFEQFKQEFSWSDGDFPPYLPLFSLDQCQKIFGLTESSFSPPSVFEYLAALSFFRPELNLSYDIVPGRFSFALDQERYFVHGDQNCSDLINSRLAGMDVRKKLVWKIIGPFEPIEWVDLRKGYEAFCFLAKREDSVYLIDRALGIEAHLF